MNSINGDLAITPPPGYEFSWIQSQSSLVLAKDGNIISAILLPRNSAQEAQRRAEILMGQLHIGE